MSKSDSNKSDKATKVKVRTNISSISWNTHFATPSSLAIRQNLETSTATERNVTLDQILGLKADIDKLLSLKVDLPRELSAIDVETSLPKLATLPPIGVGSGDDVFSSRGSVDAVFHATSTGLSGAVDVLLTGLQEQGIEDGGGQCAVHLEIFDSFEIGAVDVGSCLPTRSSRARVRAMTSHPYLSTAFLVVEQADHSLHVIGLDLSFIPHTGRNLPLVARKVTQLGNLLRYVSQVQMQLSAEVKAAFDLPSRFLRNINESLAEADPDADFAFAAHHLAVTGDCEPRVREWLVDEVGDRGLKRWEKAVGDCLDVVRRMTSECLQPALERIQVILSRLDGLARFSGTRERLGLDEQAVRRVRETVDVLGLLAEDMLIDVGNEIREFGAFMRWLKWECEVEALEEGSERAEELRETWTGEQELRTVLDYVGGAMGQSRLRQYIDVGVSTGDGHVTEAKSFDEETDAGFYADYTQRRRTSNNKEHQMPTLGVLLGRLKKQCDIVFGQIAETFRKSILPTYMFTLPGEYDRTMLDMRIVPDQQDSNLYRLVALAKHRERMEQLQLTVAELEQDGGKRLKTTTKSSATLQIAEVEEMLDVKIVDDTFLLILAASEGEIRIYRREILIETGQDQWELRHVFEDGKMDAGMKPARLEVNGRVGRRVVAVVDQAGLGFVVFDLDAGDDDDAEQRTEDEVMTG
jgi:anaphase-promoting complex subunit 4